ncbi:DUF485 domain-containing protein [Sporichthya polymorpha]|uniref:DUF485 domain-containing protein n=1 Tax=Sporichthya polymorpha TaxID=35751 RepID=UPI00039E1BFA|nr:DUF485 domain-containing protein [Sporichthya polymorpha]
MAQVDEPGRSPTGMDREHEAIYNDPEFAELRRRFKRLVFPLVLGFMAWYFLYVICATYAHDFMGEEVLGHINVGLIFGLLQFVSTFGIAYFYAKRAEVELDPRSQGLLARHTGGGAQ